MSPAALTYAVLNERRRQEDKQRERAPLVNALVQRELAAATEQPAEPKADVDATEGEQS